jgi:hypothetical protein
MAGTMLSTKKIGTAVTDVEHELTDIDRRLAELATRREQALLADDSKALDVIEVTQGRLEKAARRAQERLKLLQRQAKQDEEVAVQKQREALRDEFRKLGEERDVRAVRFRAKAAELLQEYNAVVAISEQMRAAWPAGNSHTDLAAGAVEGACLSPTSIKVLASWEFFRISHDPFRGGVPGETRNVSLPGAQCPDLRLQLQPEKVEPIDDAIRRANKFANEQMCTVLDPLRAACEPVASSEGTPSTDTSKRSELHKRLAELAADQTPEGEAKYMAVVQEIASLSSNEVAP